MNVRHPVTCWVLGALIIVTAGCNSGDDTSDQGGEGGASGATATDGGNIGNRDGGFVGAGGRNDAGPGGAGGVNESGTGPTDAFCDPADCPPPSGPCVAAVCDSAGHCAEQPKPDGAIAAQVVGDCRVATCKDGVLTNQNDDTDIPNDGNDCTDDVCSAGVPSHPARPQAASCGIGFTGLCNGTGSCVQCNTAIQCPGEDTECHSRSCTNGICGIANLPKGTQVASQIVGDCRVNQCDSYGGIEMVPDATDVNDDSNPCTTDTCNAANVVHTPVQSGTTCGGSLQCDGQGSCVNCVVAADCPAATNTCLVRTCTNGVCGTTNATSGTPCDDGNACSRSDTCQNGLCTGFVPVVCSVLDQCHDAGTCDRASGLCSNPTKTDGTACNDGNACTQSDTCQHGACTGANPVVCGALDQCHNAGTCNTGTGLCSNPNKTDGTACNDGNACTQTDTCQSGACTGANPVVCAALDQCHDAGTCDMGTGVCSNPNKTDGTACNDGNACTQTDSCQSGACTGANPVVCSALDQCHNAGTCNTGTGLCSNPNKTDGAACNDGNACTQTDACQSGACTGANPVVCSALDQCHDAGTCDMGTGVCSNPTKTDGAACTDGNACTQTDTCQSGACTGANPGVCSALDECHDVGTCDTGTGVCSNPTKTDGTTCSVGACSVGTCLYSPSGVQNGVAIASLAGWAQCYSDTYNIHIVASTVTTQCTKAKLMLACRATGASTLNVLAWAPRADVLFDTGTGNTTHPANGVAWYFNSAWSWGFAKGGDSVNRNSCDILTNPDSAQRLCWHTVAAGGYRCGATTGLNGSVAFERIVYQAD